MRFETERTTQMAAAVESKASILERARTDITRAYKTHLLTNQRIRVRLEYAGNAVIIFGHNGQDVSQKVWSVDDWGSFSTMDALDTFIGHCVSSQSVASV